jgi:uncharacterized protein (DUF1330 family)
MTAACIIVDVEIADPAHYQEYIRQTTAWGASEIYCDPKALGQSASITNLILVEGV